MGAYAEEISYVECEDGAEASLVTLHDAGHLIYPYPDGLETWRWGFDPDWFETVDTSRIAWTFMSRFNNTHRATYGLPRWSSYDGYGAAAPRSVPASTLAVAAVAIRMSRLFR